MEKNFVVDLPVAANFRRKFIGLDYFHLEILLVDRISKRFQKVDNVVGQEFFGILKTHLQLVHVDFGVRHLGRDHIVHNLGI